MHTATKHLVCPHCGTFQGGHEIARHTGAMSSGDLMRWVQSALAQAQAA